MQTRYHTGMRKNGVESGYKKEYLDRLSRHDRSIKIALFVIPCALLLIMTIGMFLPIFGIKDGPKETRSRTYPFSRPTPSTSPMPPYR